MEPVTTINEVFPIRSWMTGEVCAYGVRVAHGASRCEITSFRTFMDAFEAGEAQLAKYERGELF